MFFPKPPCLRLSQCWCSQTSDYDVHGDGTCDIPCKGNGDEMCGGDYSISVYSNGGEGGGPAGPADDPSYLGCFADDFGSRVFGVMKIEKSMSMTTEVSGGPPFFQPFGGLFSPAFVCRLSFQQVSDRSPPAPVFSGEGSDLLDDGPDSRTAAEERTAHGRG